MTTNFGHVALQGMLGIFLYYCRDGILASHPMKMIFEVLKVKLSFCYSKIILYNHHSNTVDEALEEE
jgi:hypothetical protein